MTPSAFFAYPNEPRISDAISEFCSVINRTGVVSFKTWEELNIGGKLLVSTICEEIDRSDIICADITRLNPNVLFEIGYAIAKKKRIWLIRDTSIESAESEFRQFRILTSLGYREYVNSDDIRNKFFEDKPHESLEQTVFDETLSQTLRSASPVDLLYLKSYWEDQGSVKVTQ